jgi:hypothetical protein
MRITHYSFGRITVDDEIFTSDVVIYPDRINSSWWRKEGHLLQVADLKEIVKESVPFLIIGTGYYGSMKVPAATVDYLKSKGIDVVTCITQKAVETYNRTWGQKPVVAALHLTC